MKLEAHQIILAPHITEKTMRLVQEGKYTFWVHPKANKPMIKKAVEEIFGVKVLWVNTMNLKGKVKRRGPWWTYTGTRKKAIVQLAPGQRIDIIEGR